MNRIVVKQTKSVIRRPGKQVLWLRSLGLGKIGMIVEVEDTPPIRGLIRKLSHCVEVC